VIFGAAAWGKGVGWGCRVAVRHQKTISVVEIGAAGAMRLKRKFSRRAVGELATNGAWAGMNTSRSSTWDATAIRRNAKSFA